MDPCVGTCYNHLDLAFSTRLPGGPRVRSAVAALLDWGEAVALRRRSMREQKVQIALLNVRSNIKYLNSHALDFLLMTKTWVREGDVSPLMELCHALDLV